MSKRTLVTSALPYANGPLHIGHLAGAYLPADIYVLQTTVVRYLVHLRSDEHGVPLCWPQEKRCTPRISRIGIMLFSARRSMGLGLVLTIMGVHRVSCITKQAESSSRSG